MPNPGREERYKTKTGIDLEVIEYLTQSVEVQRFRELTFNLVSAAIQNYLSRDFEFLSVGYGCAGGQHRSVFFAQQLSEYLLKGFAPRVETRVVHPNLAAIQSALNR